MQFTVWLIEECLLLAFDISLEKKELVNFQIINDGVF